MHMKLRTMVLLAATWGLASAAAAQEDHVAIFKNVAGGVKVVRSNADLNAAPGMGLFKSDRVVSDAGASAGLVFRDGTTLTVGSSTDVAIRDYAFEPKDSRYAFAVYMAKGTAIYSSGKIGKLAPAAVMVETPKAAVGVRGTRFIIQAE